VSFDPFLDLKGRKTLKNCSNYLHGPIFGLFTNFFALFRISLVIYKASDKRVGGSLFWAKGR
jgi:hypothetical protein